MNFKSNDDYFNIVGALKAVDLEGMNSMKKSGNYLVCHSTLGAVPSASSSGFDDKIMASTCFNSAIPQVVTGAATYALSEVLSGKKPDEMTLPKALSNMDTFTLNGGVPLPKDE